MLKGFGYGLAAGTVNFAFDQWSNKYEDQMHDENKEIRKQANNDDNKSIGINAKTI